MLSQEEITTAQQRAVGKAGTSENVQASALNPLNKTIKSSQAVKIVNAQENRSFGRQLSTNNGEAGGLITLQVVPDIKNKPNVSQFAFNL